MIKGMVRKLSVVVLVLFVAVLMGAPASAADGSKIIALDNLTIGGAIEVELTVEDNERDGDGSDLTLATVELGIDADINEYTTGHVLFLWEEGDDESVGLDEGYITITSPYDVTLTAGRQYLPFGAYNSHFISSPQTSDLGETGETALLLTYVSGPFELSAGTFNGSVNEEGEDGIHDYVAAINVNPREGLSFGVSWISDIADSDAEITVAHRDALIELATGPGLPLIAPLPPLSPTETDEVVDTVSGISAYVSLTNGAFTIEGEYLGATDSFDPIDYDGNLDGVGDEPETFNLEVAYVVNEDLEVAVRYEGNDDLFDLPEKQYGVAASYALLDNVSFAIEYLEGEYDNATDDKRKAVTGQLAIEF